MAEPNDFSIGAVSRLTGISQHTLRIWERRYGIAPSRRSKSGRRLYSGEDVERLTVLKALVDRGDRIGKIAADDMDTLQARVAAFEDHSQARKQLAPGVSDLAVFGETVADTLQSSPLPGSRILLADSDLDRFQTDLELVSPDALILEFPYVDDATSERINALRQTAGTDNVLLIYGFARDETIHQLTGRGVKTVRAPAGRDAIARIIGLGMGPAEPGAGKSREESRPVAPVKMQAPPRKLSAQALQRLARVTTTVECECPHHLVDLVRSLSAFELYSQQCKNRNADDAALHAYLHVTTASARALMEEALIRAAEADGIDY